MGELFVVTSLSVASLAIAGVVCGLWVGSPVVLIVSVIWLVAGGLALAYAAHRSAQDRR